MDLIQEYDSSSDSCDESVANKFSISISQQTLETLNLPFKLKFVSVKSTLQNAPNPSKNKSSKPKDQVSEVEIDPLKILDEGSSANQDDDLSYEMEYIENVDLDGSSCNKDSISNVSSSIPDTSKAASNKGKLGAKDKRKMRQLKRNSGQEYISPTGKIIEKRTLKPLIKCRFNCRSKISEEERHLMFNDYWNGGCYEKRCDYITKLIKVMPKARSRSRSYQKNRQYTIKYHLVNKKGQFEVCKTCFLNTLGETGSFIKWLTHKISKNLPVTIDFRGKHSPKNKTSMKKIEEVEEHLRKFPEFINNYYISMQNPDKSIVESLNISKIYQSYCEEVTDPLTKHMYKQILKRISSDMATSRSLTPEVILLES